MTKLTNGTAAKRIVRWQQAFLDSLLSTPNVTVACRAAQISRQQAYRVRGDDPQFAALWQEALDKSVDELEQRAFQIAMEVTRTYFSSSCALIGRKPIARLSGTRLAWSAESSFCPRSWRAMSDRSDAYSSS